MAAKQEQQESVQKGKVRIDYGRAEVRHAMVCLLQATADEVVVDFASHPLPGNQPREAVLSVHTRMGMSYATTKRLAALLSQAVARYERVFGMIEMDTQKKTAELLKKGGSVDDGTAKFPSA